MLIKQLIATVSHLKSMIIHSCTKLSFSLSYVYQSAKRTFRPIDNVRGLTAKTIPNLGMICLISRCNGKLDVCDQTWQVLQFFVLQDVTLK